MEFIIQLEKYQNKNDIYTEFQNISEIETLSEKFNIFKIIINSSRNRSFDTRSFVQKTRSKNVTAVQPNIVNITSRSSNDFNSYWNLKEANFDKLATKNIKPTHDYIIQVGIIDVGFDEKNNDLKDNIASFYLSGDKRDSSSSHGTKVSSLISAKYGNQEGIIGASLNCKLALVEGYYTQAEIVRSFNKLISERDAFNYSKGKKGSLITTINCSFGVDYGNPDDFKVWCNMIEEAGKVGILVVCSTTNNSENVDYVGDMPTSLCSKCMISVSSHNRSGKIIRGYGKRSVHLSAAGEGVSAIGQLNKIELSSGTSYASPLVASTVAHLYSVLSARQIKMMFDKPLELAIEVKKSILDSVSFTNSNTITGGNLDAYAAMQDFLRLGSVNISNNVITNNSKTDLILLKYKKKYSLLEYQEQKKILKSGVEYNILNFKTSSDFKPIEYIPVISLFQRITKSAFASIFSFLLVNILVLSKTKRFNKEYYVSIIFAGISSLVGWGITTISKKPLAFPSIAINITISMSGFIYLQLKKK